MFTLDLSLVRKQGKPTAFHFRAQLPALDGPDGMVSFIGPVDVETVVTYAQGQFWLDGTVSGQVELACARCLERFAHPLKVTLAERYVQGRTVDDPEVTCVEDDLVDLTETVRQSILLALPMRALCRVECRGLCPECGQVLNEGACDCRSRTIDPRLAGLADFFKPNPKGVE
jgi:uncharacterized protein